LCLGGTILETIIMIIVIILLTTIGGIVRLCFFSSFTIEEAIPMILICDVVIGGLLFIFKLLHIDNDNLENIIIFALLIPVGIYFTYKSTKREHDEEKKEPEKHDEN
jgi:flagellar basal body-associated protein FliL